MALGKKSQTAPEIGDLVKVKVTRAYIFEDAEETGTPDDYPQNASLGEILSIEENSEGKTMYETAKGWVSSTQVSTSVNPNYDYPSTSTLAGQTGETAPKNNGAFWEAFSNIFTSVFGVLTKKKTTTPDTGEGDISIDDTGAPQIETKTGVPTWVWITGGVVVFGGILLALFLPKKKPQASSEQPIVIK